MLPPPVGAPQNHSYHSSHYLLVSVALSFELFSRRETGNAADNDGDGDSDSAMVGRLYEGSGGARGE